MDFTLSLLQATPHNLAARAVGERISRDEKTMLMSKLLVVMIEHDAVEYIGHIQHGAVEHIRRSENDAAGHMKHSEVSKFSMVLVVPVE